MSASCRKLDNICFLVPNRGLLLIFTLNTCNQVRISHCRAPGRIQDGRLVDIRGPALIVVGLMERPFGCAVIEIMDWMRLSCGCCELIHPLIVVNWHVREQPSARPISVRADDSTRDGKRTELEPYLRPNPNFETAGYEPNRTNGPYPSRTESRFADFAICTSLQYVARHLPKPETSITEGIGSKLKIETLTGPMMVPI
jgi:hypothetical protein